MFTWERKGPASIPGISNSFVKMVCLSQLLKTFCLWKTVMRGSCCCCCLSPPKGKVLVSFSPPESPQVAGMMVWARAGQLPVWVHGTGRRHTLLSLGSKWSPQELVSSILDLPSLAAGVHQDPRLGSLRGGVTKRGKLMGGWWWDCWEAVLARVEESPRFLNNPLPGFLNFRISESNASPLLPYSQSVSGV